MKGFYSTSANTKLPRQFFFRNENENVDDTIVWAGSVAVSGKRLRDSCYRATDIDILWREYLICQVIITVFLSTG